MAVVAIATSARYRAARQRTPHPVDTPDTVVSRHEVDEEAVTPGSVVTAAPELDANRASGAITVLVAAFLIVAERRLRI
jgi:hypothetical protein